MSALGGLLPGGIWSKGGVCSWGDLAGGVCLVGGSGPRGCLLPGGVSAPGGSVLGGMLQGGLLLGGVSGLGGSARGGGVGGVSQHAQRQTPPPCGQNS